MANNSKVPAASDVDLCRRLDVFGPPPLIAGERQEQYDALFARVFGAVNPTDVIEELYVRDIVDLTWEILRFRRLKGSLLMTKAHKGVEALLTPILEWRDARKLSLEWAARTPSAVKRVNDQLAAADLTMDSVMAEALAACIEEVEQIDRMITSAEARRNAALREVDRHRAVLGNNLRRAAHVIDEPEFQVVQTRRKKIANAA